MLNETQRLATRCSRKPAALAALQQPLLHQAFEGHVKPAFVREP
jgi:hypothetical protein